MELYHQAADQNSIVIFACSLNIIRATYPEITVVLTSAYGNEEAIINALRRGAHDYIINKVPFDPDEVREVVGRALIQTRVHNENERLRKEISAKNEQLEIKNLQLEKSYKELLVAHEKLKEWKSALPPKGIADRKLRVFLCHASEDKDRVRTLAVELRKWGVEPWIDEESLLPGDDWQKKISDAVRTSDIVLICLSEKSINKEGFLQREIRISLDAADEKLPETIFLIPTKLEPCVTPERLIRWQWVDLFREDGLTRLKTALQRRGDTMGIQVSP